MDEYKDFESFKKTMIELLDTTVDLVGETNGFNHINWLLVINTGALLWFVGILDKFTFDNQLILKWWVIPTILCLLVALVIFFRLRISFFKLILELKQVKAEYLKAERLDQININKLIAETDALPSKTTTNVAEWLFLIGIISMVVYIITYFIRFK